MPSTPEEIIEFSIELGEALYGISQFYPPMFYDAVRLAQSPPSPSSESELMEIRQGATDLADTLVIYSRSITLMEVDLQNGVAPGQHDPRLVRPLLLDLLESAVLLAHVPSHADLAGLSIMAPEDLEARLNNPQVAAWMQSNVTPQAKQEYSLENFIEETPTAGTYQSPTAPPQLEQPYSAQPLEQPQAETPYIAQPAAPMPSPYPQVEPELAPAQQPAEAPPLPPEPQAPGQSEPWSQPIAKPSTEGERSRHLQD